MKRQGEIFFFEKTVSAGTMTIEETIQKRRSTRDFKKEEISSDFLGMLLWSAMGFQNMSGGGRSAPSAGACYPLSAYVAVGKETVEGIKEGLYLYAFQDHSLRRCLDRDIRQALAKAALNQDFIAVAPASIIFTATMSKTTAHYGERGIRYVYIDLGHAAENIYLQAAALKLGTVAVGAFQDEEVAAVLSLSKEESPLYIMPIGFPK